MGKRSATKTEGPFPQIAHPKKRAFLTAYAELGTVTRAAKDAVISRRMHPLWMKKAGPEADAYREAFEDAKEMACEALELEARRRAVEGIKKFKFHQGKPIIDPETGEPYFEHEFSDTLLIFLLKGANPAKYREGREHLGANGQSLPTLGPCMRLVEDDNWYGNADRLREIEKAQDAASRKG